ncbi:MAG: 50S ribosomal protein L25 [Thermomicrobiales bacterium]|nr:50S ribosomal protein L25 [Thermomicrobiales bacterium]MCO5220526.1 50S ribosomal protein L25 [Thermomicrobiales bacterium]
MSQPTLSAEERTIAGKKVKTLRKQGLVPAVVYGPGLDETVQISVDERTFSKFYQIHGHSTLLKLTSGGKNYQVLIRDVQVDPVRRNPLHVDFFAPNLRKETTASVPLVLLNTPDGPGIFTPGLGEISVSGLPREIPSRIEVDCSGLENEGDSIRVSDIVVPEGITILTGMDEIVANLTPKVAVEEPAAEEAEAGEAAAAPAEEGSAEAAGEAAE